MGFQGFEILLNLSSEEGGIWGCCCFTVSPGLGQTGGKEGHIVDTKDVGADPPNDYANLWRVGLELGGTN